MNDSTQNPSPAAPSTTAKPQPRLPFKEVTIYPKRELRQRILEIQLKTGQTAAEVLEDLLCAAAGIPINLTVIEPKNGAEAGVTLMKVDELLEKTFFAFKNIKGLVRTHGDHNHQAKIHQLTNEAMELWVHVQCLAKATFYDKVDLIAGRKVFRLVMGFRASAQKTIEAEVAKGDGADQSLIEDRRMRIADYAAVLPVLTRLGFSPEGPIRED